MYGKPLAYVVKVGEIREIPDADRIELASVMDYTVVVKKNEFKEGDLGVYVEVDSVLPDGLEEWPELRDKYIKLSQHDGEYESWSEDQIQSAAAEIMKVHKYPYFEFLRGKKFKIKSMKLSKFGVVSQGILFKPDDLSPEKVESNQVSIPAWKIVERADLTKELGITEIVQDEEEAGLAAQYQKDGWLVKKLMRYKWFRDWRKRKKHPEVWDPTHPGKSDEENVQKVYSKMYEKYHDEEWVATEKLEGQNITIFTEYEDQVKWLFFKKRVKRVGVCSRTREVPKGTEFWKTVERLGLDREISAIEGEWFCRGEHVGPGIQGNIYKLDKTDIIFFDFYMKVYEDNDRKKWHWQKLNFEESVKFAKENNLKFVPILDEHYKLPAPTVNDKGVKVSGADIMLQQSDKNTVFGNNLKHKREGFVLRLRNDYSVSFKVKNPNYSI